jgi:pimeloyl-ACP methyl ester carboxylesterase
MIDRRTMLAGLGTSALIGAKRAEPTRLTLTAANGRKVDVWCWPARGRAKGRILFSHGNFSAPVKYAPVLEAWARVGWEVLAPLHIDSTDNPDKDRYKPFDSWPTRLEDMALLAAEGGAWPYVAAGHSYGALIALVLGGATAMLPGGKRDPRVRCAVALSPPGPMPPLVDPAGYASLAVPALIQTGTLDIFPGKPADAWREHLEAFERPAPGGGRYGLVLDGVDHYFGGLICRPDAPGPPQQAGHDALIRASTLFLDAYGAGRGKAALDALFRSGPQYRMR